MIKIFISLFILANVVLANSLDISKNNKQVRDGPMCEICTTVITIADNLLKANKTEEEIVKIIEKDICGFLGSLNATCVQYVEAYGKQVIYELSQKVEPEKVCKLLGICKTEEVKKELPKVEDAACDMCTLVMTAADNLLKANKTEDEVIKIIEKDFCTLLGAFDKTCEQYVEAYGRQILYELANKVSPKDVCKLIGLCPKVKTVEYKPLVKSLVKSVNSLNCSLCKVVFTQVQNMLKNNDTDQKIDNFIEQKLCNATGHMNTLCKSIIDSYGPTILQYLAKGVDPEKLCDLIGMCTKQSKAAARKVSIAHKIAIPKVKSQLTDDAYCTVCEYAVQFIDVELKKNKTEAAIESTLEKVCLIAPASTRAQCKNLIDTYGIYLVQLLIQFADPLKVCQAIKLCH